MKKLFFVIFSSALFSVPTIAAEAPLEIKEFLSNSTPAQCASVYIGECTNGYCYGELEAFIFGIKENIPQNPQGHSFATFVSDNESFEAQYTIRAENGLETLRMNLFRAAWAPTFPDSEGKNRGVSKFVYTITKRISDGKIIFVQEEEYLRSRNLFGILKKNWKENSKTKSCRDEEGWR